MNICVLRLQPKQWAKAWLALCLVGASLCASPKAIFAQGLGISLPDQKISVAPTVVLLTRQQETTSTSYTLFTSAGAEYQVFLMPKLTVLAQFGASLDPGTQSVTLLNGALGLAYYLMGGTTSRYQDLFITSYAEPQMNVYATVGGGGGTFNFTAQDEIVDSQPGVAVNRLGQNASSGPFYNIMMNLSAEIPVGFFLVPGIKLQYLQGLAGPTTPGLSAITIWFSTGFTL